VLNLTEDKFKAVIPYFGGGSMFCFAFSGALDIECEADWDKACKDKYGETYDEIRCRWEIENKEDIIQFIHRNVGLFGEENIERAIATIGK
jgi:hypothetical protein